jgi:hypothetical protein
MNANLLRCMGSKRSFATDMASHLFGSDRRHSGRAQRTLETSKMTRMRHLPRANGTPKLLSVLF